MKKIKLILFILAVQIVTTVSSQSQKLPSGFVYLNDIDRTIKTELRYISHNNLLENLLMAI